MNHAQNYEYTMESIRTEASMKFRMDWIHRETPACGSSGCIAGHAICSCLPPGAMQRIQNQKHASATAGEILRLHPEAAQRLFFEDLGQKADPAAALDLLAELKKTAVQSEVVLGDVYEAEHKVYAKHCIEG